MPLDREPRVVGLHPLAVVLDADLFLAAELDVDGHARRAGVDGVFDELLDDGGGTLDDFAGGDLVGEIDGQPMDVSQRRQIQRWRRKTRSITPTTVAMMPDSHQNCTPSPPGKRGNGTFMP